MKHKLPKKNNGVKFAGLFTIAVIVILILAIIIRTIFLFIHRSFDSSRQFNLLIRSTLAKAELISFTPDTSSISVVKINTDQKHQNIGKELEVPIDGEINDSGNNEKNSISSQLWHEFISFYRLHTGGLNIVDLFLILVYTNNIHSGNISYYDFSLPYNTSPNSETNLSSIFNDHVVYQENNTVSIINASEVSGLGGRMAKLLSNIGVDIVAVNTADNSQDISIIASKNTKSYTYRRIKKIFNLRDAPISQNAISDIIITIGKNDSGNAIY